MGKASVFFYNFRLGEKANISLEKIFTNCLKNIKTNRKQRTNTDRYTFMGDLLCTLKNAI